MQLTSLQIDERIWEQLQGMAAELDRSRSDLVRDLLHEAVRAHAAGELTEVSGAPMKPRGKNAIRLPKNQALVKRGGNHVLVEIDPDTGIFVQEIG